MERITGPFPGNFFVAAYVAAEASGFTGYAKICNAIPGDVWGCDARSKVTGGTHSSAATALEHAEYHARCYITTLQRLRDGVLHDDDRIFRLAALHKKLDDFTTG